ncbi:MAG: TetR family transcriptional regulator [Rhodospirillales bacterium]|nr:TetR family transcriptional regulator [Rhodospirillales bacterium]
MARARQGKREGKRRSNARGKSAAAGPRRRIIDAALALAARQGWAEVSLTDIAGRAGVSLTDALAEFPTKAAVVTGYFRDIDSAVLSKGSADGDSPRDRLFDMLMRRFDRMTADKPAVVSILRDTLTDPCALACAGPRLARSMSLMLEAAGLSASGVGGPLRVKGLMLIYANALRVWFADESADLDKTMAALDRALQQAEALIRILRSLPFLKAPNKGSRRA